MRTGESKRRRVRPVLLLPLMLFANGCFGEFEEPVTNMPATLSIRLTGPSSEQYAEAGESSGYTILFSDRDAQALGIDDLQTPLIASERGIHPTIIELTNFVHPTSEDLVSKPCLTDPVAIKEDETGATVATFDGLCPDSGNISHITVEGVLDDRDVAWYLNSSLLAAQTNTTTEPALASATSDQATTTQPRPSIDAPSTSTADESTITSAPDALASATEEVSFFDELVEHIRVGDGQIYQHTNWPAGARVPIQECQARAALESLDETVVEQLESGAQTLETMRRQRADEIVNDEAAYLQELTTYNECFGDLHTWVTIRWGWHLDPERIRCVADLIDDFGTVSQWAITPSDEATFQEQADILEACGYSVAEQ